MLLYKYAEDYLANWLQLFISSQLNVDLNRIDSKMESILLGEGEKQMKIDVVMTFNYFISDTVMIRWQKSIKVACFYIILFLWMDEKQDLEEKKNCETIMISFD